MQRAISYGCRGGRFTRAARLGILSGLDLLNALLDKFIGCVVLLMNRDLFLQVCDISPHNPRDAQDWGGRITGDVSDIRMHNKTSR